MEKPLITMFRWIVKRKLRAKGYSKAQVNEVVGKIGDGQIWAWIKEHGDIILTVIRIVLPLILMMFTSGPTEQPIPELDDEGDE